MVNTKAELFACHALLAVTANSRVYGGGPVAQSWLLNHEKRFSVPNDDVLMTDDRGRVPREASL